MFCYANHLMSWIFTWTRPQNSQRLEHDLPWCVETRSRMEVTLRSSWMSQPKIWTKRTGGNFAISGISHFTLATANEDILRTQLQHVLYLISIQNRLNFDMSCFLWHPNEASLTHFHEGLHQVYLVCLFLLWQKLQDAHHQEHPQLRNVNLQIYWHRI